MKLHACLYYIRMCPSNIVNNERDCLKGCQHLIDEHLIRCCTPAFVCKGAVGRDAEAYTDTGIQVYDIGIHTSSYIYHRMYFVIDPDIPDLVLCLSVAQGKKALMTNTHIIVYIYSSSALQL